VLLHFEQKATEKRQASYRDAFKTKLRLRETNYDFTILFTFHTSNI